MSPDFIDEALRQGALSKLDAHFAGFIAAHSVASKQEAALAAALVSRATVEGHVCLDLNRFAAREVLPGVAAPELIAWVDALHASGVLRQPARPAPLILEGERLYLHRYWHHEVAVAEALRARAVRDPQIDEAALRRALSKWFPSKGESDGQRLAAAIAVSKSLAIISGGPGTGKTTTVLRVLAILAELSPRPPRMALAAPTGKAAGRLQDALQEGCAALGLPAALRARLPQEATTIHRLLGSIPGRSDFRHHRDNPLGLDVLVVDEASMIDLALMAKLLDALRPDTRLIILGDKDQLSSVEAGAILSSICASPALAANTAYLRQSFRFDPSSEIGALAAASLRGDADDAITILSKNAASLIWVPHPDQPGMIAALCDAYLPLLQAAGRGGDPQDVLRLVRRFAVLCAHRDGAFGASAINAAIENELRRRGLVRRNAEWYAGRLVMMNRNDYALGLFNGEAGIAMPDENGDLAVFFSAPQKFKRYAPLRLPACETAFAMTVHKAQGSEFDQAAFVLPQRASPVLNRELFYTAVTRAACGLCIYGSEEIIRAALAQRVIRDSGLTERLS